MVVQSVYCSGNNANDTKPSGNSLEQLRCDSEGYYFDRGGRRMFETSYDSYKRGTFNLRRGHLWKDRASVAKRCKCPRKTRCSRTIVTQRCSSRYTEKENIRHEHYSAQEGLTRWPSSPGPDNWQAGTSAYPYIATPIWLRDTSGGANGYATPTSWQGFQ